MFIDVNVFLYCKGGILYSDVMKYSTTSGGRDGCKCNQALLQLADKFFLSKYKLGSGDQQTDFQGQNQKKKKERKPEQNQNQFVCTK